MQIGGISLRNRAFYLQNKLFLISFIPKMKIIENPTEKH